MQVVLVTSNDNKAKEVERILSAPVERVSMELDELQDMDLAKIVTHKAKQAYEALRKPVMVEDVGLYIETWKGFPGPFIKWLHTTMGYDALISILPAHERAARWVVVYAYCNEDKIVTFEGVVDGSIATTKQTDKGWGFSNIFIPDGAGKPFAELTFDEQLEFSARQRALMKLKEFLATEVNV